MKVFILQINCPPYFYEIFLHHEIVPDHCSFETRDSNVILHLTKAEDLKWDTLRYAPENKSDENDLREKALTEQQDIEGKKWLEKQGRYYIQK